MFFVAFCTLLAYLKVPSILKIPYSYNVVKAIHHNMLNDEDGTGFGRAKRDRSSSSSVG